MNNTCVGLILSKPYFFYRHPSLNDEDYTDMKEGKRTSYSCFVERLLASSLALYLDFNTRPVLFVFNYETNTHFLFKTEVYVVRPEFLFKDNKGTSHNVDEI